ncbi:FtsX-like permease family protein [Sphingomonas parva]|uniref:FtsX-like permease family protein n=2 Tax=Sphingomonas parva TaxID=2555898 RepID=A0A4Y8ZU36_9SPHN|nr:FtsX-like permease family protein [Sphingomonas parva]
MWRNYLTVGYRALTKNRTYAAINIVGLAIGLAACLILLLYVRYETSYDAWLPEADRVYQIQTFGTDPETGQNIAMQAVTRPIGDALAGDFAEIESIAKLETDPAVVLQGGNAIGVEKSAAADASFFDIIQLPFIAGDRRGALRDTDSVALSRAEAMRLFGTTDVVGRTLTTARGGEKFDLRVTGVFEDLPRNTHLDLTMVRRFNSAEEEDCPWGCVNGMAYAKLKPGADAASINARMPAWEKSNVPARDIGGRDIAATTDWRLTNVRDIHLGPAQGGDRPGNDMRTIVTFTIVALLILSMAVINFVNLATARAGQRAREVAVRKVLGAKRRQLVGQFLGESLLVVAIAMTIALALVEITLPAFSRFLDADLDLAYLGGSGLLLPIVGFTLLVGLLGGLYPAFQLSRYQPGAVLKANKSSTDAPGSARLRNLLVIGQFAVSIGLIACTAIVYHQTVFARTVDPGYQRDGLLTVRGLRNPEAQAVQETLLREIAKVPGVTAASATRLVPAEGPTFFNSVVVPGRSAPVELGWYSVDPAFFDTMKIDRVAGRILSRTHAADSIAIDQKLDENAAEAAARAIVARGLNVVVNESAARQLGFGAPAAAVGKHIGIPIFGEDYGNATATIVGVVRDARFRSVRDPVAPAIYYDNGVYRYIAVRFERADPAAVRNAIEGIWRRLLPTLPFDAGFAEEELAALYGADEARAQAFGGFALFAALIACLGLFGLAAFTAERRTKEIGIRKVFGARVRDIVRLLAWQFSKPVMLANIVAWPIAWWAMRDWLNGFDARIPLGPGPFLLAGLIALAIALGTVSGHAIRVARLNPIHALRYE